MAAYFGNVSLVRLLLEWGVLVDVVGVEEGTAFHCACFNGHAECVAVLVKAGCDTTLRDNDGETGRQIAERHGHAAVLSLLDTLAHPEPE